MKCEHVEELLSLYLDNALALEDRQRIATHLQACSCCSAILTDYRRFDALIAHLPRRSPDPALRERIFSSSQFLQLTGTFDAGQSVDEMTAPYPRVRRDTTSRPRLVALPGGRSSSVSPTSPRTPVPIRALRLQRRRDARRLRVMQTLIAAVLLLTLSITGYIGWNLWHTHTTLPKGEVAITPPAGLPQGPLPAGMRFVFLRDGTLWSGSTDGSMPAARLTPPNVTVATNWVVRPALPGHAGGNLLAYIDLQQGFVHLIRSDGQSDTAIQQPLLKPGVLPASVWDTQTGISILSSLTWSNDGSMLAFVADPHGTGELALYIYSTISGEVHAVPLPLKGSVSRPVWSPDSIRLAFELLHNGQVSILDYNTQNQGLLTITSVVKTKANPTDDIVTLDWSPDVSVPAITWSVGKVGHIHSIWQGRVGVEDAAGVQILAQGSYAQAVYSQAEYGGSWLLVSLLADHTGDIERVDLNSTVVRLTRGKSANFAQWSPDGKHISYLDAVSAGVGTLHEVNLATGIDTLLASGVAYTPSPTWSFNSQHLVYSTGTHIGLVDVPKGKASRLLKLQGSTSAFLWSATQAYQLLVVLDDVQQGIYLVDIQSGTLVKLDKEGTHGPLLWTEIS